MEGTTCPCLLIWTSAYVMVCMSVEKKGNKVLSFSDCVIEVDLRNSFLLNKRSKTVKWSFKKHF